MTLLTYYRANFLGQTIWAEVGRLKKILTTSIPFSRDDGMLQLCRHLMESR